MSTPKISMIAAIAKNDRAIGFQNQLLWHIPEDLKHFKEVTSGHPVIMGERTYHSLGRPLPNRVNIVISDDPKFSLDQVTIARSLDEALQKAKETGNEEIFVIGGGSIYKQFLESADRLYLTLVEGEYEADTFFPEYPQFTRVISEESHDNGEHQFTFVILEKN